MIPLLPSPCRRGVEGEVKEKTLGTEAFGLFEISRAEIGVRKLRFSTPDHGKYQRASICNLISEKLSQQIENVYISEPRSFPEMRRLI